MNCYRSQFDILTCPPIINVRYGDSDDEYQILEKINSALSYDLVILRNFLPKFGLNNSIFTKENITLNCKLDQKIDVIEQSLPSSASIRTNTSVYPGPYQSTSTTFTKRSRSFITLKKVLSPGHLSKKSTTVSTSSSQISTNTSRSSSRRSRLCYSSARRTTLSYVRQHIGGMTIPQMYIKVKDAWT